MLINFVHVLLEALAFAVAVGGVGVIVGKVWEDLTS